MYSKKQFRVIHFIYKILFIYYIKCYNIIFLNVIFFTLNNLKSTLFEHISSSEFALLFVLFGPVLIVIFKNTLKCG